jgi:short-subunit dehydrogenase
MIKKNSRILVTGASRGLGKSLVEIMVKKNLDVTVVARGFYDQQLEKKITFIKCNILKKDDFSKLKKELKNKVFDTVIHCVGGGLGIKSVLSDKKLWEKSLFFNAIYAIELNNILVPNMIKNKIRGKLIHISSYSSIDGGPDFKKYGGAAPYTCSKAFLNMYVKTASNELKHKNINFVAILPGPIMLEHKHWFKLKKKNPEAVKKFQKDYMKNAKFLTANQVGKFIFKAYKEDIKVNKLVIK